MVGVISDSEIVMCDLGLQDGLYEETRIQVPALGAFMREGVTINRLFAAQVS